MNGHPHEELSAYADGELPKDEASRIEEHLQHCTECMRELALTRSMGEAMRTTQPSSSGGVWERVHGRLTRPVAWVLLVVGFSVWVGIALVSWFREEMTLEWLAATAVGVGLVMLLIGIAYEQYREWKRSPYKDIER